MKCQVSLNSRQGPKAVQFCAIERGVSLTSSSGAGAEVGGHPLSLSLLSWQER